MELWSPPHDRPHLFEWWRPLLLASQQARRRRLPWPIHLDEFRLAGRVLREDRPDAVGSVARQSVEVVVQ